MMSIKSKFTVSTVAVLVLLTAGLAVLIGACTDKLAGEFGANEPPKVFFTNIPPDGEQFSRNPVVYWYGTDTDGLIEYYRYHVWAVPSGNTMSPEAYIATVDDSLWSIIEVDPTAADQKTTNSIPLQADSSDPVTSYVRQYIFIQAFDYEGMGSEIAYRLYSRNTNPPNTAIFAIPEGTIPFVNSVEGGGVNTGVWLRWQGSDKADYPKDPPPFEFEWRLYGPFGGEGEPTLEEFYENYRIEVFITREGQRYRNGEYIYTCDTIIGDEIVIECDSFIVDQDDDAAMGAIDSAFGDDFGSFEPYLRVSDTDFINSEFNTVAARSSRGNPLDPDDEWVMSTADTIYNVYRDYATQETIQRDFVFWIRSRDDAFVADLVPAFRDIPVIEPKHERDVVVINFTDPLQLGGPSAESGQGRIYMSDFIRTWGQNRLAALGYADSTFQYDDTSLVDPAMPGLHPDYVKSNQLGGSDTPLRTMLQHKVAVLYNDGILKAALFDGTGTHDAVFKAIDAGVNAWLTMRASTIGGLGREPDFEAVPTPEFFYYFGVTSVNFSGWHCWGYRPLPGQNKRTCESDTVRIEDFVGTYALNPEGWPPGTWPELEIDDSLLQARYLYPDIPGLSFPYDSTKPALPEVGWSSRVFGTEPIYLYKSMYGADHPLGGKQVFEAAPVMHTYDRGLFRTVNMNFTLTAIKQEQADSVVALVLNYLMEPWEEAEENPTAGLPHYNEDAPAKVSVEEARRRYLQRVSW